MDLIQLSIHSETNEFVQRHVKSLNFEDALDIDLINLEVASITNGNSFIHLQPLFDGKNTEHHKYHLDEVITDYNVVEKTFPKCLIKQFTAIVKMIDYLQHKFLKDLSPTGACQLKKKLKAVGFLTLFFLLRVIEFIKVKLMFFLV